MNEVVSYRFADSVSTIVLDDGKVNALSPKMIEAINRALDKADNDSGAVILTGRQGMFSAGFDLREREKSEQARWAMVKAGALLAQRIFSYPRPVILACSGHAVAMGAFLLTAATIRIGAEGAFKIGANEVSLGMTVPRFATELCRHRLTISHQTRSLVTGEMFTPSEAVTAGFLDSVVPADHLMEAATEKAIELAGLSKEGYRNTLIRLREPVMEIIQKSIEVEYG